MKLFESRFRWARSIADSGGPLGKGFAEGGNELVGLEWPKNGCGGSAEDDNSAWGGSGSADVVPRCEEDDVST